MVEVCDAEWCIRIDTDVRFAVANVEDNDVRQLGERLSQLNEIMGMA